MKNHKGGIYNGIIAVIEFIVAQGIIKIIGVENIPVKFYIAIFAAACLVVIIGVIKNGKKGYGIKYNITFAILIVVLNISMIAMVLMFNGYQELLYKHGLTIIALAFTSIISLALFVVIYDIAYKINHR
ncbi:MAG: hypothetical protein K0R54_4106 [Clostridiaceae bacterium]|nr:hypothetical protein [Clostridiaceae bacterium]